MKYVSNYDSLEYSLLTTQCALVDVVTWQLRAVVIRIDEKERVFHIHYYHEGEIDEELIDLWQCATTEATADSHFFEEERIIKLDYPQKIPLNGGNFAYLRKEDLYYPSKGKELQYPPVIFGAANLAVLSALLGRVTPELKAVFVDTQSNEKSVYISFYYDGEITAEIRALWEKAIEEVRVTLKDFNPTVDGEIERADYTGGSFKEGRGFYVYCRKED